MDVQEVKKLDAYLKKLFGNPHIRVVPKKGDVAEVFVGEDDLGELTVDDEDGDRSYNFRMVIQVSTDPSFQPVPTLTAYLRAQVRQREYPRRDAAEEDGFGGSLYRRRIPRRAVCREREGPPVLYFRVADPRRRSRSALVDAD